MREHTQAAGSQTQWEDRDHPVRAAVSAYLQRHPMAADSLAGICGWWLPAQGLTASADAVEPVLAALVADGLLERIQGAEGTVIYRAARATREN